MENDQNKNLDLLNEFASGEDEFDVDLMACGCRLAVGGVGNDKFQLSIHDIARLYNLDQDKLIALVGGLVDTSKIDPAKLMELADQAAQGKLREVDTRLGEKSG
jgi:hypothetical protein